MRRARAVRTAILIAAACAASCPGLLVAQSRDEVCDGELLVFPLPPYETFDANQDEAIDESEAEDCASLRTVFMELDLNADQRLSRLEYSAFATLWSHRAISLQEDPTLED